MELHVCENLDQAALLVRAALCAAVLRARLPREAALRFDCRDSAPRLAVFLDSRFSARETPRERDFEVFLVADF